MARRNPPAKWVLPDVVDPDRLCIQIEVPNDPAHIAAFRGALLNLANAYRWADDPAHTAKDVALVWRDIIDNMGEWGCSMLTDVRQNDTLPCVLEKNLSGEWQPFANLRYCPPNLRISGGKIQYYDEGTQTWVDYPTDTGGSAPGGQPGVQPGGDEPIPAGVCEEIILTTQGNGLMAVPFRVVPGDNVYISGVIGGWSHDGSIVSFEWTCGTGKQYAFGMCGSVDGDDTGSIVAAYPLGRLICQYGDHFFDAQADSFDIPVEWDEATLFLRMNDPDLSNNAGSVTAKVTVCSGAWCFEWDFTTGTQGWTLTGATARDGGGLYGTGAGGDDNVGANLPVCPDYVADRFEFEFNASWSGNNPRLLVTNEAYPNSEWQLSNTSSGNAIMTLAGPLTGTDLGINADRQVGGQQSWDSLRLAKIRAYGVGTNPFGENNC